MTRAFLATAAMAMLASLHGQELKPVDELSYPKLISSHKGKVLLVDFWATWCVPCRAEMPQIAKMEARLRAKGLQVVTVSADEPETAAAAAKFLRDTGAAAIPAYIKKPKDDDKFIQSIDPKWQGALPALFLYDKAGKRIRSFYGETAISSLEAAITKLL